VVQPGRWQLEDENWCDYGSVGIQKTNALHRKSRSEGRINGETKVLLPPNISTTESVMTRHGGFFIGYHSVFTRALRYPRRLSTAFTALAPDAFINVPFAA